MNGWAQAASVRDQEEKIRTSQLLPTTDSRILYLVEFSKFPYREDSLEGLSSHPKNESISGNKRGCQKQEELSKEAEWQSQRAAPTFQLLSEDHSNPPGLRIHLRGSKSLQSLSPPIRGADCHLSRGWSPSQGLQPSFLGGVTFIHLKVHGPTAIPPGLTARRPTEVRGLLSRALSLPFWSSSLPNDRGVLVGVAVSPLGVVVIVTDFLWSQWP